MRQFITGSFATVDDANDAVDSLIRAGYNPTDISVMMNDKLRSRLSPEDVPGETQGTRVVKDAAGGGLIGGALGAIIAGSMAATGAIGAAIVTGGAAIPFIAGPIAAALAGGGAGAAAGGIIGALTGYGITHEESRTVERDIQAGNIVIGVHTQDDDLSTARSILNSTRMSHI
jgi:hypothetical protein